MLPLNNNVEREEIQNILNQIGELYTLVGNEVILYPLKIVSGIINLTETGEQPLNYDTKSFTSNVGVITSNAPIVCYWEGAFKSQNTPSLPPLYQEKIFSAENGRKIKTWIVGYNTEQVVGSAELNNNTYTTIMLNRNIRSFSRDWNPDDNEMRNYLYLYLDKKANSPQFLRLTRKEPRFIPTNNKFVGCDLEFTNLNVDYSQSGKDIFNFVKMTNPGGNYAFPKEIQTDSGVQVVLDTDKINNRGVKDIQLEFNSPYALNSINIIGRLKDNTKIFAPRKLLLINPHTPITSAISVDGASLNNYYASYDCVAKYQSFWANWHEKYEASYNFQSKKTYNGGLEVNYSETEQTNPSLTEGGFDYTFNLWLNWIFHPTATHTYNTTDTPFCANTLTITSETNQSPADFLNMNSFINYTQETLPLEWGESTRGMLGDYGLLGKALAGFLQTFTFGYNIGWTTNNTWVPAKPINLLIPATTYFIGKTISAVESSSSIHPIMFDVFDTNTDFTASGNNCMMCGYRFELTHLFQDSTQVKEDKPAGEGGNGIWDTQYLGQTKYESGEWINENHTPVLWTSNSKAYAPDTAQEYEIDMVCYQGIGKSECRMTFSAYRNLNPAFPIPVYETRQQTNAKFKNDMHLWRNLYKLNYSEEANNEGYVEYPSDVLPPIPTPQSIRIYDMEGTYNSFNITDGYITNIGTQTEADIEGATYCENETTTIGGQNIAYIQVRIPQDSKGKIVGQEFKQGSYAINFTKYVGDLTSYESITFLLKISTSSTLEFSKRITIDLSDLTDNQWTPIKIADISEITSYENGGSYPNSVWNYGLREEGGGYSAQEKTAQQLFTTKIDNYANKTSDIWFWAKLNRTTNIIAIGFDNPDEKQGITSQTAPKSMYRTYLLSSHSNNLTTTDVKYNRQKYGNYFGGYRIEECYLNPTQEE